MKLINLLTNQADPNQNNYKIEILSDPNYARNGTIFTAMRDLGYSPDWLAYEGDPSTYSQRKDKAVSVALGYYLIHGAEKTLTSMTARFYETMYPSIATGMQSPAYSLPYNYAIARILIEKFKRKWDREYLALMADYDPVNNYDMVETENIGSNIKTETTNGLHAFESTEAIPTSTASTETSGASASNERTLKRSGNIGTMTSSDVIEKELELRKKNFLDMVYRDIDSIMCLDIYD